MNRVSRVAIDDTTVASPHVIPVTRLRELYEWLRFPLRYLGNDVLHKALAEAYWTRPKALEDLFLESLEAFEAYNNPDEPFSPHSRNPERFAESSRAGTVKVVKAVQKTGKLWLTLGTRTRAFQFVDREVGTLRSTPETGPWIFSDGRSASNPGLGGLDMLMVEQLESGHQLPVVGEIKVGNDATPFLALIQALTYAVELATCSQSQRLLRHYGKVFPNLLSAPSVGLLLLMIGTPMRQRPIREATSHLLAKLYERPRFAQVVRTTVIVDATLEEACLHVTSAEEFGRKT